MQIVKYPHPALRHKAGPVTEINEDLKKLVGGMLELMYRHEGLGLAARDCYGAMGHVPEEVRVAGGAARSKALKTILASVLGAPVRESSRQEAGAAGAAMMAAVAVGIFPDMAATAAKWVTPLLGDLVRPDPKLGRLYDRLLPVYVATRTAMTPIWAELAGLRRGDHP